jgi:transcriptional antiterminator Rof (Rho-off)
VIVRYTHYVINTIYSYAKETEVKQMYKLRITYVDGTYVEAKSDIVPNIRERCFVYTFGGETFWLPMDNIRTLSFNE